ncbi:3-hydroxy-3-methylglutaryl-coenzyme A (HMG-CoA) reductase isozyme [Dionaea muscipula]
MYVRRRPPQPQQQSSTEKAAQLPPLEPATLKPLHRTTPSEKVVTPKPSEALPFSLYLANVFFLTQFFSVVYFLLVRWREKIRNSTPLHVVSLSEIAAMVAFLASFIYLLAFFGIDFVHSFFIGRSDIWASDDDDNNALVPNHVSRKKIQPIDDHRDEKPIFAVDTVRPPLPPLKPKVADVELESSTTTTNINNDDKTKKKGEYLTPDDEDIVSSVVSGTIPSYSLESKLGNCYRAVKIRREALQRVSGRSIEGLPVDGFDYESILGQCCEMPVGYVQIPVGIAGPLLLDGKEYSIPMATTEGCLVASTNRGCKAIHMSGGAISVLLRDGMTRAPVVRFGSAKRAAELKLFLEDPDNFDTLSFAFNKSSRFARLQDIKCAIAGKNLYMRFTCSTGDAMGMNMVSKGVQNVVDFLQSDFPDMDVVGISGNYCSDKKPAAVNWIEGRGKSVVCEAIVKEELVKKVLKTDVGSLVELNMLKNLAGSAMAGALGGFNAHAANIVSAIYIATGQDPAQNVESSHCMTMMEAVNGGKDLHISVTMPCIEVGTVGGGTQLPSQSACLNLLGVKGANNEAPGENARRLATIVAGSVLAGELSLMSAISAGQLVKSHMKYNRSTRDLSQVNVTAAS